MISIFVPTSMLPIPRKDNSFWLMNCNMYSNFKPDRIWELPKILWIWKT